MRVGWSATVPERVVTAAYLEVWTAAGRGLLALEGGQLTLGADPAADPPYRL